ncbi:penicillin-binding protein [Sphingomonas astaxanthinifaciens DSM 22298]|uniref:peptidoglycan glycosyltransferase n=2 Tax=Sphingomonas TaxID=13687 RepID=A0ABQ5Z5I9_9SPHN|nr:PBP1A family penicillin-binding protein [Sphingomonas astaxanthinifaciens]GLR46752.1 penicillin-binding protein [Sphingomonas astaxanthinifaciens DSM 22298]
MRVIKWGIVLAILGLIALGVAVSVAYTQLPSYQSLSNRTDLGQNIRVRSADGKLLVQLGPNLGQWIPYDRIPATMRAAMIAVEDKRFRSHPGVDPIGMARSIKVRLQTGRFSQGGSTITQQLARNIFLNNSRNFGRKFKEAVLALALEAKFSKNQILELYLNRVYFGGGAYGIDAASRTFFGHSAERLSLGEATIIAGLVKAPSNYSPTADVEAARSRAGVVLKSMVENGFVSADAAANVDPARIVVQQGAKQNSIRYFTDWALPQLDTLIDESSEPIEVWTTLDTNMQAAADAAINANSPKGAQGALVALDRDGAVRAMIGGRDYVSSIYNRATQAQRQPGSAFKLFVYLAALESGMKPTTTLVDEPIDIEGWRPRNSTRTYLGPVTLREAFARSINTISAKIGAELGFGTIADMARRFGITSSISTYPSMVLGTSDVRLLDMTRAFASVAAQGVSVSPYAITRVTSGDGRLLYRHAAEEQRTLVAPWVAAGMTDLLQTAVMSGTGRAAQIGRPVAGKTGTTQTNRDGWFIGFSSGITAGVWMGRDDAKAIAGLQGGTAPARAFHDFMVKAVANRPVEQFQTEVPMPDWQLEPGEESYLGNEELPFQPQVDADGNPFLGNDSDPLAAQPAAPQGEPAPPGDETEIDKIFGGQLPPPERPQPAPAPQRDRPVAPAPASVPPDGTQRRTQPSQF